MKTHRLVAWIFMIALVPAFAAAEAHTLPGVNHEMDYVGFLIEQKQQQLGELEKDLAKMKHRSLRRQYYAGTESRVERLRQEVAELVTYRQTHAGGNQ